ncbi:MAG: hypothetical protein ACR2PB_11500 [Desulfocapsaceae bacterium]
MKSGYESLVWINDKQGKEYVCSIEKTENQSFEDLNEDERALCTDVNQIVGTERW